MRKIIKIALICLLVALLPFAGYFGMAGLGLIFSTKTDFKGERKWPIYIATGQIHADFILPVKNELFDWGDFLNLENFPAKNRNDRFIQMGWGDRGFYLDMVELENLTLKTAIEAALLPSETLMHVTLHQNIPPYYRIKKVLLTKRQYQVLVNYLMDGFKRRRGRPVLVPGRGYYGNDNFYAGEGSYHLFNTCNLWTTRGMRRAGIRTSIFSPFKYGVDKFIE